MKSINLVCKKIVRIFFRVREVAKILPRTFSELKKSSTLSPPSTATVQKATS
jgi:hypothetical protein